MNTQKTLEKHVLIGGAGFAGIQTALDLLEGDFQGKITLINSSPYFTYYPALHKIISDQKNPVFQVLLTDVFNDPRISIIVDEIIEIVPETKSLVTKNQGSITGDVLVLSLGSQTDYFNVPGLQEGCLGIKSYSQVSGLRKHIVEMFEGYHTNPDVKNLSQFRITIVGGGPSGVDTAGELAIWTTKLARLFRVPKNVVTIDLIESGNRLLSMLSENASEKVLRHLRRLGVNVFLGRNVLREENGTVYLSDMDIKTHTLIWTAGVRAHGLYEKTKSLVVVGGKKRVTVDDFLCAVSLQGGVYPDVYIAGDGAESAYSGLAQTAIRHGEYIAKNIINKFIGRQLVPYIHKPVVFHIGVGTGWSVMKWGPVTLFGFFAHTMRTFIDLRYFLSILPFKKVWELYRKKKEL